MGTGTGPISSQGWWKKPSFIDDVLARQLSRGSVSLVVGAGASFGFGLPSWEKLVKAMYKSQGVKWPRGAISLPRLSDDLRKASFAGRDIDFSRFVRDNLYGSFRADASSILGSPLLQAIGAFLVTSIRGRANHLISFNFDDLLETYLEMLGFVTRSVTSAPFLQASADMQVLHPHGLLPSNLKTPCSKIVFTESDYDRVIGRESDAWNRAMAAAMLSSTCIFIGLSGDDQRLRVLLGEILPNHPVLKPPHKHAYWAVRPTLASKGQSNIDRWKDLGVAPRIVDKYEDVPTWLLGICQKAARLK